MLSNGGVSQGQKALSAPSPVLNVLGTVTLLCILVTHQNRSSAGNINPTQTRHEMFLVLEGSKNVSSSSSSLQFPNHRSDLNYRLLSNLLSDVKHLENSF